MPGYPLQNLSSWSAREHQELELRLNHPVVKKEIVAIKSRYGITDKKTKELQHRLLDIEKKYGTNIKPGTPAHKRHTTATRDWISYYRGIYAELPHLKLLIGLTHVPDMFLAYYILFGKKTVFLTPKQSCTLFVKYSKNPTHNRLFVRLFKSSTIRTLKNAGKDASAWKKHYFTPVKFNRNRTKRIKTTPIPQGTTLPKGTRFKVLKRKDYIDIEIFSHTPISAIQQKWKEIAALQRKLPGIEQFRIKPQFQRDNLASTLKHKGMKPPDISRELINGDHSLYGSPEHVRISLHRRKNRIKPI